MVNKEDIYTQNQIEKIETSWKHNDEKELGKFLKSHNISKITVTEESKGVLPDK